MTIRSVFRSIRLLLTLIVMIWVAFSIRAVVTEHTFGDAYRTPTEPYVSVDNSTYHSTAMWKTTLNFIDSEFMNFMRFGN